MQQYVAGSKGITRIINRMGIETDTGIQGVIGFQTDIFTMEGDIAGKPLGKVVRMITVRSINDITGRDGCTGSDNQIPSGDQRDVPATGENI